MPNYDAMMVQKIANRLYAQAKGSMASYATVGALVGFYAAYVVMGEDPNLVVALIAALLVGIVGYFMGRDRATSLHLQAQLALCQSKIEENTRLPATVSGPAGGTPTSYP